MKNVHSNEIALVTTTTLIWFLSGAWANESAVRITVSAPLTISPDIAPNAPEVLLGDRLFFETRFAQYFYEHSNGDANAALPNGDSVTERVPLQPGAPFNGRALRGPFRGEAINCRQCHLGDDFRGDQPLAQRTYCDFTRRSAVPGRGDGVTLTDRNSPVMVNLGLPREVPTLLHFDGEFASVEDLVFETLTGRNFGWLQHERATAIAHIANVIRNDSGLNPRRFVSGSAAGIPYAIVMLGLDPSLPSSLQIPPPYRIDVRSASDEEVVRAVAKFLHAYMNSLRFGRNNTQRDSESPYDLFLERNALPTHPTEAESAHRYADRLLRAILRTSRFTWVTDADARFSLHKQEYRFEAPELRGLKLFLTRSGGGHHHAGNCVSCHAPPQFTDHKFHNTGVSQAEYDAIFGQGAFATLYIPGVAERNSQFDDYMPRTHLHPKATSTFRSAPTESNAALADLGSWNILANPDFPKPQAALLGFFCPKNPKSQECEAEALLPRTIATFKTPTIRDLGHSGPYFHSGAVASIESVVRFYIDVSRLMRGGRLRNGSVEILNIFIDETDVAPLTAFLRSLNEDYH